MSRASRFPILHNMLTGASLPNPPEDDEDDVDAGAVLASSPKRNAAVIDANAVDAEVERIAAGREKTANDRWNKVITSEAGLANPKAAARLLVSGNASMSADEIIDTLGDLTPAAQAPAQQEDDRLAADRRRLAADKSARPDTGGAAGDQASRRDEDGQMQSRRDARAARQAQRNTFATGPQRSRGSNAA